MAQAYIVGGKMKIIFEIDADKLPPPFRLDGAMGKANLINFLHEQLYATLFDKELDDMSKADYLEAFFDKQKGKGAGKKWVKAIADKNKANLELGKMLLDSMKMKE
jgi:hypothetical protein